MKRLFYTFLFAGWVPLSLFATVVLPLGISPDETPYNLQSTNGVPLSSTVGYPVGSDGSAPANPPPTAGQFNSMLACGGVIPTGVTFRATSGGQTLIQMKYTQVGLPFVGSAYAFGSIISPPLTDYKEELLPTPETGNSIALFRSWTKQLCQLRNNPAFQYNIFR